MADRLQKVRDLSSDSQRVPPQALDAEISLLGGLLIDHEAIHKIADLLRPDDFYKHAHQRIYRAALTLFEKNEPTDVITLSNELGLKGELESVGGTPYLAQLAASVATSASIHHYAKIIREKAMLRSLITVATDIVHQGYAGEDEIHQFLDDAERSIFEISERNIRQAFTPVREIIKDSIKAIENLYENKSAVTGISTGFAQLNKITAGLQKSDLIIVAGRPSMGKTAFALNLALNAAIESNKAAAIFSLEMSKDQLVQRMLCSEARVDSSKLRGGYLKESDWPKLFKAADKLTRAPLFIDDTPALTVLEMRAKTRRLKKEHELGLVVVDYLQLMRGEFTESREREISEISRSLKALAKELRVPVVALSQLNRGVEMRQNRRPQLADLRESGAIEQDADLIAFIYRDEVYNKDTPEKGIAEIIIGKQRNGPIGTVRLKFFNEYTLFEELEENYGEMVPEMVSPPSF
jgi:replicative DNA helicase